MELKIEVNSEPVKQALSETRKAVPYAMATALTWLAKDAQRAIIDMTYGAFKIRTNWLTGKGRYGVLVSPATKDHLESNVRSSAPWMMDHATGSTRVATKMRSLAFVTSGGKTIEAPSSPFFAFSTYGRAGKDRKPRFPRAVPVALKMWGDGSGTVYGRDGSRLVPMRVLKPSVRIPKRWFFIESGMATVQAKQGERLQQAADLMLAKFKG